MSSIARAAFEHAEATLPGHRAYRVLGEDFPALVPDSNGGVIGRLWWGLGGADLRRLDRFEGALYVRKRVRVETRTGRCLAWAYLLRPLHRARLSAQRWDYDRFREGAMQRYLGPVPSGR